MAPVVSVSVDGVDNTQTFTSGPVESEEESHRIQPTVDGNNYNYPHISQDKNDRSYLNNRRGGDFGRVHHTLDGITHTHRSHGDDDDTYESNKTDARHHNDVLYDDDTFNNVHHHDGDISTNSKRKTDKNVDPHNHFYDNAFEILKADELSILRDEDLSINNNNNNNNINGDKVTTTTSSSTTKHHHHEDSSLDHFYDVDYSVGDLDDSDESDDITTTVTWQEVEDNTNRNSDGDDHNHHRNSDDCHHDSEYQGI